MKPVKIEGKGVFISANRAAKIIGEAPNSLDPQFCRSKTWYGYPIRTLHYAADPARRKHWLADERDIQVMALVKREISVSAGLPSRELREKMKALALTIRDKLERA